MDLAKWALLTSLKFTTWVRLNIRSIRVFDQIRDPDILITLRPLIQPNVIKYYNENMGATDGMDQNIAV